MFSFSKFLRYLKFRVRCFTKHSKLSKIWTEDHSPMLVALQKKLGDTCPFRGIEFGVCLPGTWESLMFLSALEAGGARINYYPMFCKPEVGAELSKHDSIRLFGFRDLEKRVKSCDFVYDSTALFGRFIVEKPFPVRGIIEQTASGISIYRDFDSKGLLRQPVLDLDGSHVKRVGENRLATGLGLVEALLRLHLFLPDKEVLVLGFGNVGSGCADFLRRMGCGVTVFDVDDEAVGQAVSAGYQTGALEKLLPSADIVVNVTGASQPVLKTAEFKWLKPGVILANMGGYGWDRTYFQDKRIQPVGDWVSKIFVDDDLYLYELAQGFPVNFLFASGSDTETMDMVFSLSVYALQYLVENYKSLPSHLLSIPEEIQKMHMKQVAELSARKNFVSGLEVSR